MKLGEENSAAHQETTQNAENKQGVDDGGMKSLEGYFDNLAAAAVNEKLVLEQLVANNTKLSSNNSRLVAMVKKLTGDIKNVERDNSRLKKSGQSSRVPTACYRCKKDGYHAPNACCELAKNKGKLPPGWISLL